MKTKDFELAINAPENGVNTLELTVANELEIAKNNNEFIEKYGLAIFKGLILSNETLY